MDGFVIEYLSDLLGNIKFFSGFIVLFAGMMFFLACLFHDEYSEKVYKLEKKYIAVIILACMFSLFLPSGLKYNYVNHYIEENGELRKQVNEMNYVIQKYELEQQLAEIRK